MGEAPTHGAPSHLWALVWWGVGGLWVAVSSSGALQWEGMRQQG